MKIRQKGGHRMEIGKTPASLLKTAAKAPQVTLEQLAGARDSEKVKKEQETQNTLQSVLAAMKRGKSDLSAQRKAAAAQKVAYIKQAIQALKMSSFIDPKMVARMAARLAKDLAQAVKEYKAAGGTASDLGTGDTAAPATQGSQPLAASQDVPAAALAAMDAPQTDMDADADADAPDTDTAHTKAPDAPQNAATAYGRRQDDGGNKKDDDIAFDESVRDVVRELRKLLRANRWLLTNDTDDKTAADAERTLRQIERLLTAPSAGTSGIAITA